MGDVEEGCIHAYNDKCMMTRNNDNEHDNTIDIQIQFKLS